MSSLFNSIRNNVLSVSFSQFASLLFNIITFGIAARALGIEDFGYFNFLLAGIGVLSKIIDLGVNPIVFRESAKDKEFDRYILPVLTYKLILILVIILSLNAFFQIYQFEYRKILIINFLVINIFLSNKYTTFRELLIVPYKVNLKMIVPATIVFIDNILLLILTMFLGYFEDKLLTFSFFYLVSNLPGTIIIVLLLKNYVKLKLNFNFEKFKYIFIKSLPIWGYVILTILLMQSDIILLKYLKSETEVGIYSAALRLSMPLIIIPSAVTMSIFPIIIQRREKGISNSEIVETVLKVLAILAILFFLFIYINSDLIITIIFGDNYLLASEPLLYLLLSMIFIFTNYFLLDYFTANDLQKLNLWYASIQIVVVVPFYFLLIPILSYNGAAIAKLFSFFVGSIFLFWNLIKYHKVNGYLFKLISWILFSVIITLILPILFTPVVKFLIISLISVLFLFIFKVLSRREIVLIKNLFMSGK